MNIDEIRSKAPEGATHYSKIGNNCIKYIKFEYGQPLYFNSFRNQGWLCYSSTETIKPL